MTCVLVAAMLLQRVVRLTSVVSNLPRKCSENEREQIHPNGITQKSKIAMVGWPTSISGTYLPLGYKHTYEKEEFVGGLRDPRISVFTVVQWEVELMKDLGVKVEHGQALGRDFTLESLKADGAKAVLAARAATTNAR